MKINLILIMLTQFFYTPSKTLVLISLRVLLASAFLLPCFSMCYAEGIAVIVNPASKDSQINIKTVRKIFLGKSSQTDTGATIVAVDQKESNLKELFYKKVTRKTPVKLKLYWTKKVMSGKGVKLQVVGNDDKVLEYVASHIDSISFISKEKVNDSVKVLLLVD